MFKFTGGKKDKQKLKTLEEENKELRLKLTTLEDLVSHDERGELEVVLV